MPTSNRIQSIIQKHVELLARELAQELTQPLVERFGSSFPEAVNVQTEVSPPPEPHGPPPVYDSRSRKWICPKCHAYSDPRRRAVTAHARFCTGPAKVEPKAVSRRKPKKTKKS